MQTFLTSVSAVGQIVLMTAVGFFLGKLGWVKHETKPFLVKYIMNIAMPCMCINSILGKVTRDILQRLGVLLLVSACTLLALMLLAYLCSRWLKVGRRQQGVFMIMCFVSNSMFIGYPMCTALFGEDAVPFVLCYYIVNTVFFQSAGVAMLNRSGETPGEKHSVKKALKALVRPPICAILISLGLLALNVTAPPFVMRFTSYMGATVTPMALLYTGFVIYELGFSHIKMSPSLWVVLLFRFAIAPLMCVGFCALFGVHGLPRSVLMIECAMPVMTQAVVLSADCGADEGYAAIGTAASTLLCFVMIPILMQFV